MSFWDDPIESGVSTVVLWGAIIIGAVGGLIVGYHGAGIGGAIAGLLGGAIVGVIAAFLIIVMIAMAVDALPWLLVLGVLFVIYWIVKHLWGVKVH